MFNGIVLNGNLEVGSFKYHGEKVNNKLKTIEQLTISKDFFDICRGHSTHRLLFVYFAGNNQIILAFGHAFFNDGVKVWCDIENVNIERCFLINNLGQNNEA